MLLSAKFVVNNGLAINMRCFGHQHLKKGDLARCLTCTFIKLPKQAWGLGMALYPLDNKC